MTDELVLATQVTYALTQAKVGKIIVDAMFELGEPVLDSVTGDEVITTEILNQHEARIKKQISENSELQALYLIHRLMTRPELMKALTKNIEEAFVLDIFRSLRDFMNGELAELQGIPVKPAEGVH